MYSDNDFGGPVPSEIMLPWQKEFIFGRTYDPEAQTVLYHCKYRDSVLNISTKDISYNIGLQLDKLTMRNFANQCCHYCSKNDSYGCSEDK